MGAQFELGPDGKSLIPLPPVTATVSVPADTTTPVKAGIKTTEFWLTLFSTIFFAVVTLLPQTGIWAQIAAVVGAALTVLGYGQGRANVKANANF